MHLSTLHTKNQQIQDDKVPTPGIEMRNAPPDMEAFNKCFRNTEHFVENIEEPPINFVLKLGL